METSDLIGYIVIVLLGLAVLSLLGFILYRNKQTNEQTKQTQFFTFVGYSDGGGSAKLECPIGTSINVIDARMEVYDPLKQCTYSPIANSEVIDYCQITGQTDKTTGKPILPGIANCSVRDATPYVAQLANGKNSFTLPTPPNSILGPSPCDPNTDISQLPKPSNSTHQGYYIHGIYSCL